ncbi:response regulator transcription factor [uncultured Roseibium sp.]|uniref:response regulator n=1 Tax=uncultured Roseibium sp. TaxID=1936171 RepID=UPI002606304B|nr:response regulator transcription factor [uncultured Roseibium sp.]
MSEDCHEIIICDDEAPLRRMLSDHLSECGYLIREAEDATSLFVLMNEREPDLVLLDVRMPGKDGQTALRELRKTSVVPVLMLTAAGELVDKILGLEFGADDYLVKPVDLRELQARIKATIRRNEIGQGTRDRAKAPEGAVQFGPSRLDVDSGRLFGPDGNEVTITAMEFRLLRVFAANRGRILIRDQLLEQAHDKAWEPFDRSIDLRISRIRRKIEPNPDKPEIIRTVRGVGYIFD